jgi:hypothetical protein
MFYILDKEWVHNFVQIFGSHMVTSNRGVLRMPVYFF